MYPALVSGSIEPVLTLKAWDSADYCCEKLVGAAPLGTIARELMNLKAEA